MQINIPLSEVRKIHTILCMIMRRSKVLARLGDLLRLSFERRMARYPHRHCFSKALKRPNRPLSMSEQADDSWKSIRQGSRFNAPLVPMSEYRAGG